MRNKRMNNKFYNVDTSYQTYFSKSLGKRVLLLILLIL